MPGGHDDADQLFDLRQRIETWMGQNGIDQWEAGSRSLGWYERSVETHEWWLARGPSGLLAAVRIGSRDPLVWHDRDGDALYVHDLMADRTEANRGWGSALLDWVESLAVRRGVLVARLDCMEANTELVRYYQRHGFHRVGRAQDPYPHRGRLARAVLMEKPLTPPQ